MSQGLHEVFSDFAHAESFTKSYFFHAVGDLQTPYTELAFQSPLEPFTCIHIHISVIFHTDRKGAGGHGGQVPKQILPITV